MGGGGIGRVWANWSGWEGRGGGGSGMQLLGSIQGPVRMPRSPESGCAASLVLHLLNSMGRSKEPPGAVRASLGERG